VDGLVLGVQAIQLGEAALEIEPLDQGAGGRDFVGLAGCSVTGCFVGVVR
jgi:hypothetical protein